MSSKDHNSLPYQSSSSKIRTSLLPTNSLLVPTNLRRCRSASPLSSRFPLLSKEQQALIKRSWQKVPRAVVGNSICAHMTTRNEDMRPVFGGDLNSIQRHARHFVGLLQCAIDNIADLEQALQPWLDLIGQGHNGFAIRSSDWDALGEAIVDAVTKWISPGKGHKETVKAWMLFTCFLSDCLGAASRAGIHNTSSIPRLQLITLMVSGPPSQLKNQS